MVSTPVLVIFLTLITIYLSGCLFYHIRDIREERKDHTGSSSRSTPRHGGAHAIRP